MASPQDSAITEFIPLDEARERVLAMYEWASQYFFSFDTGLQLALVFVAVLPAMLFGPQLRRIVHQRTRERIQTGLMRRLVSAALSLATPLALLGALALIRIALGSLDRPFQIVAAAMSVMTAWIVIRAVTLVIRSRFWSLVAFYIAWPVAALDIFGLLDEVVDQMQALAIPLGETEDLSLFDVVRTLIYFVALFWLASAASRALDRQLQQADDISPAFRALISKAMGVILPALAFVVALQLTGFNLATLAIFSGALGIGVGLGLQRTVSNFAAGFTLLADKSIKPGDGVEVDGTFGWVTQMQGRYVSIRTRDGTELLIPNETFIANGVINWSRSDRIVRLHAPFGVSYATRDLRRVQELAQEAAKTVDRVVPDKNPVCNVMEFGDSSVNFDLRFWIQDPQNGLSNVTSEVYLALWDALHEDGIEIPFPQRDIYIKQMPGEGTQEASPEEAEGDADEAEGGGEDGASTRAQSASR